MSVTWVQITAGVKKLRQDIQLHIFTVTVLSEEFADKTGNADAYLKVRNIYLYLDCFLWLFHLTLFTVFAS